LLYYLSADEPFWGPPLFFCVPSILTSWNQNGGTKEKLGPKKVFPALRTGNRPHFQFASYAPVLIQVSAFLEEETLCHILQKYLNYITRWRHICVGIRSKFGNFSKFERQRLCAQLRPFRRRI